MEKEIYSFRFLCCRRQTTKTSTPKPFPAPSISSPEVPLMTQI